jgi:hypothetical protein
MSPLEAAARIIDNYVAEVASPNRSREMARAALTAAIEALTLADLHRLDGLSAGAWSKDGSEEREIVKAGFRLRRF